MNTYGDRLEAALATEIRVELASLGMEQKGLAEKAGIERATMSRYLTHKRSIPMPTFFALAEALGVTPQSLMQRAADRVASVGLRD